MFSHFSIFHDDAPCFVDENNEKERNSIGGSVLINPFIEYGPNPFLILNADCRIPYSYKINHI